MRVARRVLAVFASRVRFPSPRTGVRLRRTYSFDPARDREGEAEIE